MKIIQFKMLIKILISFKSKISLQSKKIKWLKFYTKLFMLKMKYRPGFKENVTGNCSWLPNQMISMVLIFGFLCRSYIFRYPDDLRNIVQQCATLFRNIQSACTCGVQGTRATFSLARYSTLLYYISQVIWVSKYRWST